MSENNGTTTNSAGQQAARNVNGLAHDALTLLQLQGRLLRIESTAWFQGLVRPTLCAIIGSVLALACAPILLFSVAAFLVEFAGMTYTLSLIIAACIGVAAAAVFLWIAWRTLQTPSDALSRSREELERNVDWLKKTLCPAGHSNNGSSSARPPDR